MEVKKNFHDFLSWIGVIILVLLYGCGNETNNVSTVKSITPDTFDNGHSVYERFNTNYSCNDVDLYYQDLISRGDYSGAIHYVCNKYSLSCQNKWISAKLSMKSGYAYTSSITNHIILGPKAFKYPNCSLPHDGWLGAVIGHEIIHTTQSQWTRYRASLSSTYLGHKKLNASLEIPAWRYMLNNADKFRLTTMMRIEIDSQIEAYTQDYNTTFTITKVP